MTVKVTREAEPQIELYGAYSGQLDGNGRVSLTFTATDTYLIMVAKNAVSRPQLELGAFATSYIPTDASTVTRNADVASLATSQFPYSQSAGSIVVSYDTLLNLNSSGVFSLNAGSSADRIDTRSNGAVVVSVAGVDQGSNTLSVGSAGTINKVGVAISVDNLAAVANGGTAITDTTVTMPAAATVLNIGYLNNSAGNYLLNGHIRQITYVLRRLTDAELIARTA